MKVTMKKKKASAKEIAFYISLVFWALLHWAVFWLYVNGQTIALTFQKFNGETFSMAWFDNYVRLIPRVFFGGDTTMFNAFKNSFHSIAINLIILPLAVIISYAFYKKIPCQTFFRVIFYLPNMISMVVLTMCFRFMFYNSEFVFIGPIAAVFNKLGFNVDWLDVVNESHTIWPLIYTYCIWSGLGANVILICGNMQRIPQDLADYCKIDGVGFWRELFTIVVPLIMPTLTVFFMNTLMSVFGFTYAPMFIVGDAAGGAQGQAYTLGWYIFNQVASGSTMNLIDAATIGISWSLFMIPFIFLFKWFLDKITPEVYF